MSILGYVRLGKSLRNLGRTEEAIAAFERAAELDPANSDTVASLESLREILNGENCIPYFVFCILYFLFRISFTSHCCVLSNSVGLK